MSSQEFSKIIPAYTSLGWSFIDETNRCRRLFEKQMLMNKTTMKRMYPMIVKRLKKWNILAMTIYLTMMKIVLDNHMKKIAQQLLLKWMCLSLKYILVKTSEK